MKSKISLKPGAAFLAAAILSAGCFGSAQRASDPRLGINIAERSLGQVGKPYLFGGKHPESGFDCSGLAQWAHESLRLSIPRSAKRQFRGGRYVHMRDLRPGDLVFFRTGRRGPSHVGVFVGRNSFVHAPSSGKKVRRDNFGNTYWKKRYLGARRYW